ncbi:hypothetical protein AKJ58_01495 [candidate division MSBL1 archaeon SCGC-AAA385D11]|uniref:Uncharacterized protein n=1 Tax=candidate division MSBL1 archaeon SCGC-AAA385D11 TaxID=1698286 RepID=A0A133VN88_9EURY|nr:hypothetical protein AKJ58_01495 [candidate division MSBL1 archaeon SCGC-AAA385D11]
MVEEESHRPLGDIFCPECGSSRLYYFLGLKAGHIYVCKDCGYHGPVVIEGSEIAEELQRKRIKEIKEKRSKANNED